ncbi:hypothetical protein KBY58_00585 [Cyanobium sp. HWJ4-Hawea]|nr:hypothetical protein [Cyanobium sp. HWJ4-Hawea]
MVSDQGVNSNQRFPLIAVVPAGSPKRLQRWWIRCARLKSSESAAVTARYPQ